VNRWLVAAAVVVTITLLLVILQPDGCDDALGECGGLQVSPVVILFVGGLLAAALVFAGLLRSPPKR
jgi:hypothetical protein